MATFEDFECKLRLPNCDLGDLGGMRRQLKEMIDDDAFAKMFADLGVAAKHAGTGPAPRASGEFGLDCRTDFKGGASCGGSLVIRF
jgi:hypothetical protein